MEEKRLVIELQTENLTALNQQNKKNRRKWKIKSKKQMRRRRGKYKEKVEGR